MLSEVRGCCGPGICPAGAKRPWSDLARLAIMPTPRRDLTELRTEAAAALGTPDIRLVAKVELPADDLGSFTFSPDGRTLLTAGRKTGLDFWDVPGNRHLSSVEGLAVGKSTVQTRLCTFPTGRALPWGPAITASCSRTRMASARPAPRSPRDRASRQSWRSAPTDNGSRWPGPRRRDHGPRCGQRRPPGRSSRAPTSRSAPTGDGSLAWRTPNIVLLPIASEEPRIVLGRYDGVGATALAFSPDGTRLAVAFYKQNSAEDRRTTIRARCSGTWRSANNSALFGATAKGSSTLAFSPDGEWIATGSLDYTARIWETRTGQNVATLSGSPARRFGCSGLPRAIISRWA